MDFKDMPWHLKLQFLAYTLPVGILIILPLLIIALLNPFWFRSQMMSWLESSVHAFARQREKWMKPQLDKWSLFKKIKNS